MITTVVESLAGILVLSGSLFLLLGSLGIVRFPDVYSRVHALGLASTMGIFLVTLGSIVIFLELSIGASLKGLLAIAFILVTFPVITHAIAWSAYKRGIPMSGDVVIDELKITEAERTDGDG